ncbi:unnamed protein product [Choristocarpus tenellus]
MDSRERPRYVMADAMFKDLSCPVCFEVVKDCVVTPCGHSFCRECASDAINRKRVCPVCQSAVEGGEAALRKNFMVVELAQTLQKSSEETEMSYMRLLAATASRGWHKEGRDWPHRGTINATAHPGPTSLTPPLPPGTSEQTRVIEYSPIEGVLIRRLREAFLGYQAYYDKEKMLHETELRLLADKAEAWEKGQGSNDQNQKGEGAGGKEDDVCKGEAWKLLTAIEETKARFAAVSEILIRDLDAHAAAVTLPPSLLPTTVTVLVASRGVRFETQILPTHYPGIIYDKVRAYYAFMGDEVVSFGPGQEILLQRLADTTAGGAVGAGEGGAETGEEMKTGTIGTGLNGGAPSGTAQGNGVVRGGEGEAGSGSINAPWVGVKASSSAPWKPGTRRILDFTTVTVFEQCPGGRVGPGWALVVDGPVALKSEILEPCYADTFVSAKKGPGDTIAPVGRGAGLGVGDLVDYYSCKSCDLKWVCSRCAVHCHRGHEVRPYVMGHKPTWACCYCSRKARAKCKLAGLGTASSSMQ